MKMDLGKMTDEQLIELLREGKTEICGAEKMMI